MSAARTGPAPIYKALSSARLILLLVRMPPIAPQKKTIFYTNTSPSQSTIGTNGPLSSRANSQHANYIVT